MIENKNEVSKDLEKALGQAKQHVANEKNRTRKSGKPSSNIVVLYV